MLFVLNDAGVPSVARFVRLRLPVAAYVRPRAGAVVSGSLTVAYQRCTNPNRTDRAPFAFRSCQPPTQTSSHLTIGTADANGKAARSLSRFSYVVRPGNPATVADEADVRIRMTATDVRNRSDLRDYAGELRLAHALRITDRSNGFTGAGTVSDLILPVTVPCSATADAKIGSMCSIDTTADAIVPGSIREGRRSVWRLGRVGVSDGGADGNAETTGDNTLFLSQGLFVP